MEGIGYDKERDFLIIYTTNVLKPGAITIRINFVRYEKKKKKILFENKQECVRKHGENNKKNPVLT